MVTQLFSVMDRLSQLRFNSDKHCIHPISSNNSESYRVEIMAA